MHELQLKLQHFLSDQKGPLASLLLQEATTNQFGGASTNK